MKLKYVAESVSKAQINWGGNDDPTGLLEVGKEYEVAYADVRSQSTRIFLKDFPGKQFNVVWFADVDVMSLPALPPTPPHLNEQAHLALLMHREKKS